MAKRFRGLCVAALPLAGWGCTLVAGLDGGHHLVGGGGAGGVESTATTSGETTGGPPMNLARPPGPKAGAPAPDGAGSTVLAIKKLYLGDTNRDGTSNKINGWRQYGYDLDGLASTAESTGLCQPLDGNAPKNVYPDGDNGIDNSFGKNILPLLLGIASDISAKINQGLATGAFTMMLRLDNLGAKTDYAGVFTRLYDGKDLGAAPKFDGTDAWPVKPESLSDEADVSSARVQFPGAYLVNDTWVSGGNGELTLRLWLSMSDLTIDLAISHAVLTMDLAADHHSATNGTIAGIISTKALTSELRRLAGSFDPSLCKGPTIDSIIMQIEQASDILQDGTQRNDVACDGVSIGLGFDAGLVTLGAIGAKTAPATDGCATMGSSSTTSTGP
jgi:hypothetical protein